MTAADSPRVWYVAYASNLALERFRCYLRGGPVPGGSRVYPGCRDRREPADTAGLLLPGGLVFAGRSTVWGGGIAFHDPDAPGEIACRGYLVTHAQLADVVAQETRQPPGGAVARQVEQRLRDVDSDVRSWGAAGLYDRLMITGARDGVPLVTLTHRDVRKMRPVAPTAAYLRWIVAGLGEAHGWGLERTGHYLARMPGCPTGWTAEAIAAL